MNKKNPNKDTTTSSCSSFVPVERLNENKWNGSLLDWRASAVNQAHFQKAKQTSVKTRHRRFLESKQKLSILQNAQHFAQSTMSKVEAHSALDLSFDLKGANCRQAIPVCKLGAKVGSRTSRKRRPIQAYAILKPCSKSFHFLIL